MATATLTKSDIAARLIDLAEQAVEGWKAATYDQGCELAQVAVDALVAAGGLVPARAPAPKPSVPRARARARTGPGTGTPTAAGPDDAVG